MKKKPVSRVPSEVTENPSLIARIEALDETGLIDLWKQIDAGHTPGWPPGKAFELSILRAFQLEEAVIQWPYHVKIQDTIVEEIDGFVKTTNIGFMVESKDLKDAVGIAPVAKLRNQLARRPAGLLGCVFSRAGFTQPAVILSTYCGPQAIMLWTGKEASLAFRKSKMTAALEEKYEVLLKTGLPDYEFVG